MTHLRIRRRRDVLFLMVVVGALLLASAYEIAVARKVTAEPDTNEAGIITTRGQTQRRTDFMWGGIFAAGGLGLMVAGVGGLVSRSSQFEITDDGLRMNISHRKMTEIPWDDILSVTYRGLPSDGRSVRPTVAVTLREGVRMPMRVTNADVEGQTILLDADMWDLSAEDVAAKASLAFDLQAQVTSDPRGNEFVE
ncbi:hypothetical protein BMS3Bbin02_00112 [bacterium BMS3Bbin02]|nr:hypothetical protein BMS3Bbin02_00112 [bacterium BMS3Bbin02]